MILGENLDAADFIDGFSYTISAQGRFTIYFNQWDDDEGKYFKSDLIDMMELPNNHKFDVFKKK